MRRVGIIQVWQESNGFNPVLTTRAEFEAFGMGTGEDTLASFAEGEEVGGFVKGLRDWDVPTAPVGLLFAQAWPGGPITKETRKFFVRTIVEQLDRAGSLDGVLMSLHGALIAEDENDVDGLLLEKVRTVVGPDVPIVATLDLHAHYTARMNRMADALVAYHTNPHLDRMDTGRRGARVLEKVFRGARPTATAIRLPMLTIGEVTDTSGPVLAPIFERVAEFETRPDVLGVSVLMAQPYLDVPDLGWTILVVTDAKADMGKQLADELAEMSWSRREQMTMDFLDASESITAALACEGKPVVLADGADATNSGAGGDSVHLLGELIGRSIPDGALTIMVDPQAVACAQAAGIGGEFNFPVGGKRDNIFSQPLEVRGKVVGLQPARYVLSGHLGDSLRIDMGNSATVRIGDVTLLLVEKVGPGSSPMMYRCAGLEPKDYKIVVVKSPGGFRAGYAPFAAGVILSACPGCASGRLGNMPYKNITRPVWPLDDVPDWQGVDWVQKVNVWNRE